MALTRNKESKQKLRPFIPPTDAEIHEGWSTEPPTSVSNLSSLRELAKDLGLKIRMLHFYEDWGLIRPKDSAGFPKYDARDKLHLQMIQKGKKLGLSLAEIKEILSSAEAMAGPETKLLPEQISARISHLERQRSYRRILVTGVWVRRRLWLEAGLPLFHL